MAELQSGTSPDASTSDRAIWLVRGGASGEADSLFLGENVIAVSWPELGDLEQVRPDIESFRSHVAVHRPSSSRPSIQNNASQVFRFSHVVMQGDVIVYPSKIDGRIHIGMVTGGYKFKPALNEKYPHTRSVFWITSVLRESFTASARGEMGSILTIFQIKRNAFEVMRLVSDHLPAIRVAV